MSQLSIITINLNNAGGLQKTLRSIMNQTYENFELIIIDGGSTDNSGEIIREFESKSIVKNKLSWVSEPDEGIYNAQNKGIQKATGEYLLFLNSGDYLLNNLVLEKVFKNSRTAGVIYGNMLVYSGDKLVERCEGKHHTTFLDIYSSSIKHQSSFIKKDLFDMYGFYDESLKIIADWAFFMKTLGLNDVSLEYIDLDISVFEKDGISYSNMDLVKLERQKVFDKYLPLAMQEDYALLQKYRGIRIIDRSRVGRFLFRVLAKCFKILLPRGTNDLREARHKR